jgi:hypothetical protein
MTAAKRLTTIQKQFICNIQRRLVPHERFNISLEMPVPSQGHYGFHSFPVVG